MKKVLTQLGFALLLGLGVYGTLKNMKNVKEATVKKKVKNEETSSQLVKQPRFEVTIEVLDVSKSILVYSSSRLASSYMEFEAPFLNLLKQMDWPGSQVVEVKNINLGDKVISRGRIIITIVPRGVGTTEPIPN